MKPVRLGAVLAALAVATLLMLPLQLAAIRFFPARAGRLPMAWQRFAARLIGLKVRTEGAPAADRPLLIVSNHVSWLDIVTLGSLMPVSFVAKAEVGSWPVVKWLARLQRSIFIDRTRHAAKRSGEAIASRLSGSDAIVLFAEGTTDDGISVLPFRSALVGAAREASPAGRPLTVQPVAIVYTALQGLPIGRLRMSDVAWHGDMDLAPHLAGLVGVGAIDAVVAFGSPIAFGPAADRKAVTAAAEAEVRRMVRSIRRAPRASLAPPRSATILTEPENG